jgi:hypothetical protein
MGFFGAAILGPLIGGVVGGGMYQLLIHPFLPARKRISDTPILAEPTKNV